MNIPQEAIEAGAKVCYEAKYETRDWEDDCKSPETWRAYAEEAIKAAAPLIAARAWDEALDDMAGCCVFLSDIEEHKAANPYHEPADD